MNPDTINACFEAGGALLLGLNVRRLYLDKTIAGVSLWPVAWWNLWGFWNCYYYAALVQPLSFWGGVAVVVLNTVWLGLALWYRRVAVLRQEWPLEQRCGVCDHPYGAHKAVALGKPSPCKANKDKCHCNGFRARVSS